MIYARVEFHQREAVESQQHEQQLTEERQSQCQRFWLVEENNTEAWIQFEHLAWLREHSGPGTNARQGYGGSFENVVWRQSNE